MRKRYIVLADRGLGILETLKQVRPTLKTHIEAVNVAFTEILSGRAPENEVTDSSSFVKLPLPTH